MEDERKETYDVENTEENKEETALAIPTAPLVFINRGQSYDIIAEDQIVSAKIQKIYEDPNKGACVLITVPFRKNFKNLFHSRTNAMTLVEFKQRMLDGGIDQMKI